jgi:prophage regulatory protein
MSIIRMPDVLARTGHRSPASIYTAIRDGLFTSPVHIGRRAVGWPEEEVRAINAARAAARSLGEIRELVGALHARRVRELANRKELHVA